MSKSVEELFRDAPPDATHYAGYCHYKKVNDVWMVHMDGDEWDKSSSMYNGDIKPADIVERLQPKPWSGPEDGLPPAGTVCESMWNESRGEWFKAKVFGANEHNQPIFRWEEGPKKYEYQASPLSGHRGKPYFRPVKTSEQLAAEQRETAIADMAKVLPRARHECWTCNPDGSVKPYENTYEILGLLVDAGFKREVV